MARRRRGPEYRVAASFDTETSNVMIGGEWHAFPVLYQFGDLRDVDIGSYELGMETPRFFRTEKRALAFIETLVGWGMDEGCIPVVCGYNLMFDLQSLIYELRQEYEMEVCAQSATHVYTLDLMLDGRKVLRFWDTFYLEMGGLAAMGETCGLPKLAGDWDYDLVRTPDTPLTDEELGYALRDVQVIPAYLRYVLDANAWAKPDMLGNKILTKTSIVRQMGQREIAKIKFEKANGKRLTVGWAFMKTCKQELPANWETYGIRRACFRGGLTFTAGKLAMRPHPNVWSFDVTSMHHAFINGRKTPVRFREFAPQILDGILNNIRKLTIEKVLESYDRPFDYAFDACVRIEGIRLRRGTPFERWGIACLAESKFRRSANGFATMNQRGIRAEEYLKANGFCDVADNATFAFSKLVSADAVNVFLNEHEWWCVCQVYEFDSYEVLFGEATMNFRTPPDYITLQSNILFARKNDAKVINNSYEEGVPYDREIPASIPSGIADELRAGTMSAKFFESWYSSTVKGSFNSIYGTQAQDIYKPDMVVDEDAEIDTDDASIVRPENWEEHQPGQCKVLYTYGSRIVAGSRMHLVIAMELIARGVPDARVLGGDTDSLKISTKESSDGDILRALEPLHVAVRRAIDVTQRRVRELYPELASDLAHIGEFDCEGLSERHVELWNKCRVYQKHGTYHVTCAGLSRPRGAYTIEDFLNDYAGDDFSRVLDAMGYNVYIPHEICHSLQRTSPRPSDVVDADVTDHMGETHHVHAHEAVCLYPQGRWIGESTAGVNSENLRYMRRSGTQPDTCARRLSLDGSPHVERIGGDY